MQEELGFEIKVALPYEEAKEKVTTALKAEGFGILTSIDVKATIKEKLGEDFRPYTILGACNPPLAHRALTIDETVGLMLPCNVTVEASAHDSSIVRIINPEMMLQAGSLSNKEEMQEIAHEARTRLERVAAALRAS